ncbi:lysylphosphatidylglycerol synthase transmembrane domain-containing protein [Lactobacillus psittaci]|uniref:Phosphatidylglycerol lysyltransferase n=1 Tax=Lactobacillus psittaci DSM 15354 TaxID=1122152 RepID=A0A0R1RZP6_9LACO|nr:lysylphosphatidylglycerol synthase transmembrane domain-containing protein [Lactobacillus psittaci]KRL62384.1 hypothetical protein FC23_GL000328 [Lactobacillus psittaci DSM 15354]
MKKGHLIGILVVLIISSLVLYQELKTTNFTTLVSQVAKLNYFYIGLIILIVLFSYLCEAGILQTLSQSKGVKKLIHFYRVPLIQSLFNAITPLATGGQPAQLFALSQMGYSVGSATSLLMMKFIIYQIVVFFAYIITFVTKFNFIMVNYRALSLVIILGFILHISSIVFLFLVLFAYRPLKKITYLLSKALARISNENRAKKFQVGLIKQIDSYHHESKVLMKNKRALLISLVLTILQIGCYFSVPFLTLLALNLQANYFDLLAMNILVVLFMATIPIPGASGGAEFSFQALFKRYVVSNAQLVLGLFIWRFFTYFMGMLLGIFAWIFKPAKSN